MKWLVPIVFAILLAALGNGRAGNSPSEKPEAVSTYSIVAYEQLGDGKVAGTVLFRVSSDREGQPSSDAIG